MDENTRAELIAQDTLTRVSSLTFRGSQPSVRLIALVADIEHRNERPEMLELSFGVTGLAPLASRIATGHKVHTFGAVTVIEQDVEAYSAGPVDVQPDRDRDHAATVTEHCCVALTIDGGLAAVLTREGTDELLATTNPKDIDEFVTSWQLNTMRRVVGLPTEISGLSSPGELFTSEARTLKRLATVIDADDMVQQSCETKRNGTLLATLETLLWVCRGQSDWNQVLASTIAMLRDAEASQERDDLINHLLILDGDMYARWLIDALRCAMWGISSADDVQTLSEQSSMGIESASIAIGRYRELLAISDHLNLS